MLYYLAGNTHGGSVVRLASFPDGWHAQHMQWTTTPPTEEGWYWVCVKKGQPHIVRVTLFGSGESRTLWAYLWGNGKAHDLSMFTHWLGPLPVPEPPE